MRHRERLRTLWTILHPQTKVLTSLLQLGRQAAAGAQDELANIVITTVMIKLMMTYYITKVSCACTLNSIHVPFCSMHVSSCY